MSQAPAPAIRDALPPFSGEHDADAIAPDLILRSGDGVDLHVHKAILGHVSVFFKDMLAGAGNETDLHRDGKPVVVLPEPSAVLHRLLCLAYPGSVEHYSLLAHNLDGVCAVHEAADKYLFKEIKTLLERILENPVLLDAHPHRIFTIARLRNLSGLARTAALVTLKCPVCPPDLVFPELELLPAATFQRLHEFHHACGKAAEKIVNANSETQDYTSPLTNITHADGDNGNYEFVWWKYGEGDYHTGECGPDVRSGYQESISIKPAEWFKNHVGGLAPKLRVLPVPRTVEKEACALPDEARAITKFCHACHEHAEHDLVVWGAQLGRQIEASNNQLGECPQIMQSRSLTQS